MDAKPWIGANDCATRPRAQPTPSGLTPKPTCATWRAPALRLVAQRRLYCCAGCMTAQHLTQRDRCAMAHLPAGVQNVNTQLVTEALEGPGACKNCTPLFFILLAACVLVRFLSTAGLCCNSRRWRRLVSKACTGVVSAEMQCSNILRQNNVTILTPVMCKQMGQAQLASDLLPMARPGIPAACCPLV